MVAEIMNSPKFAEICFLIAFILFCIEFVLRFANRTNTSWGYGWLLMIAGLAFIALGFLALPTGP